ARLQQCSLLRGSQHVGVDFQFHPGKLLLDDLSYPRKLLVRGQTGEPEPQESVAPLGEAPSPAGGVLDRLQDALRVVVENRPGSGQFDLSRGAGEQLHAELRFQLPDRLGQRRLSHVQPLSRPTEMPGLGNCEEVAQVPQFHRATSFDVAASSGKPQRNGLEAEIACGVAQSTKSCVSVSVSHLIQLPQILICDELVLGEYQWTLG